MDSAYEILAAHRLAAASQRHPGQRERSQARGGPGLRPPARRASLNGFGSTAGAAGAGEAGAGEAGAGALVDVSGVAAGAGAQLQSQRAAAMARKGGHCVVRASAQPAADMARKEITGCCVPCAVDMARKGGLLADPAGLKRGRPRWLLLRPTFSRNRLCCWSGLFCRWFSWTTTISWTSRLCGSNSSIWWGVPPP